MRQFAASMSVVLQKRLSQSHSCNVPTAPRYHKPVPVENTVVDGERQSVILYTDPQPGGLKIGQAAIRIEADGDATSLADEIDQACCKQSCVGIFFDNFDGDVLANWGQPGAADAWEAYLKGFANLYCDNGGDEFPQGLRIIGNRIVFIGMTDADDLQTKALELAASKRTVDGNKRLCALAKEHSLRLVRIVKDIMNSTLVSLFLLGGGDNAIYACSKAVKTAENRLLLLRIDRHMDERDTGLRSDPSNTSQSYPHSGNGVTQAKDEKLISYDFLLGCDYERNNDQCMRNSEKRKDECYTSITSIEKMRFDPKSFMDSVIKKVAQLLLEDDQLEVLVNIDCDTFNGIPSSAITYTGGLDKIWAFYFLEKLSELPRLPRIIRIAELHFSGDAVRKGIAADFAAEMLRSGVKGMQKFDRPKGR